MVIITMLIFFMKNSENGNYDDKNPNDNMCHYDDTDNIMNIDSDNNSKNIKNRKNGRRRAVGFPLLRSSVLLCFDLEV